MRACFPYRRAVSHRPSAAQPQPRPRLAVAARPAGKSDGVGGNSLQILVYWRRMRALVCAAATISKR